MGSSHSRTSYNIAEKHSQIKENRKSFTPKPIEVPPITLSRSNTEEESKLEPHEEQNGNISLQNGDEEHVTTKNGSSASDIETNHAENDAQTEILVSETIITSVEANQEDSGTITATTFISITNEEIKSAETNELATESKRNGELEETETEKPASNHNEEAIPVAISEQYEKEKQKLLEDIDHELRMPPRKSDASNKDLQLHAEDVKPAEVIQSHVDEVKVNTIKEIDNEDSDQVQTIPKAPDEDEGAKKFHDEVTNNLEHEINVKSETHPQTNEHEDEAFCEAEASKSVHENELKSSNVNETEKQSVVHEKLKEIDQEIKNIKEMIENFDESPSVGKYRHLEETLTNNVTKLNELEIEKDDNVMKNERKRIEDFIRENLNILEEKVRILQENNNDKEQ